MKKLVFLFSVILLASCSLPSGFIVAGVIRNSSEGWNTIENANHAQIGISQITEDATDITIHYSDTASKVISLIVTPDETFASEGYFVGASVGLELCNIRIYKDIDGIITLIKPSTISSSGNFWVYGVFK